MRFFVLSLHNTKSNQCCYSQVPVKSRFVNDKLEVCPYIETLLSNFIEIL